MKIGHDPNTLIVYTPRYIMVTKFKYGRVSRALTPDYSSKERDDRIAEKERRFINALECRIGGYDLIKAIETEAWFRNNLLKYYITQKRIEALEIIALQNSLSQFKIIS